MTHTASRLLLGCAALATAAGITLSPAPAHAWWRGGVFIGVPPVVVGPAYPPPYYYPPAYYAPGYYPPAAYYPPGYPQPAPPQQTPAPELSQAQRPYGATCYAGVYTCAAAPQTQVGSGCSCPGIGAPSFGEVQ